jgi:SAM-dependent methyltransferase
VEFEAEGKQFNHIASMYLHSTGFGQYWQNARRLLIESTLRRLATGCRSLLDVGCAEGLYVDFARQLGYQAYGIDLSEIKLGRSRAGGIVADAQSVPFSDKSFDVVMLNRMVEYVPDDGQAIAEAARIARRYVVVTVPRGPVDKEYDYPWGVRGRYYNSRKVSDLLTPYGRLAVLRSVVGLGYLPYKLGGAFVRLQFFRIPGMRSVDMLFGRVPWTMSYAHELFALLELG